MIESIQNKDATGVQDHFWSFLHASQLLWFYVGGHFKFMGANVGSAKAFVQDWETSALDEDEKAIWKAVNDLRTSDVHVEPVVTEEKPETRILMRDGKILISEGKILCRTTIEYFVIVNDKGVPCQEIASRWIGLARRMIEHLLKNPP
jgi:hypothetical protein